ncbi:px domain-containing protein [Diplodia corticola]|uniref:Px domain-containing protein n=1 Tax=Diplodia corticola TaxID=236234 RepID=A0A1J9RSS6_9PEZI|nr:px domain-containing protein [Diplodia corticola]OJD30916.1 px domain-containing protein [Diplodia corticola]
MPGYDIRAYLSNASASVANPASTATAATTTEQQQQQQQQQQQGTTTPRTPRRSSSNSSTLPPRRHLPWLHGTKTPSTTTTISPRTPRTARTVRISEGGGGDDVDLTPTTTTTTTATTATTTITTTTPRTAERVDDESASAYAMSASTSRYRTPRRGRGGDGGGRFASSSTTTTPATTTTTPRRGRFSNNTWYCDCNAAAAAAGEGGGGSSSSSSSSLQQPASRFRVKKEGPNKGRWFYTCHRKPGDERRCGFFLWEEEARARVAEGAGSGVAGAGAGGVGRGKAASGGGGGDGGGGGAAAAKRKWQEEVDGEGDTTEYEDGDEDEYGWGKDVGVEDAIGRVVDAVSTPSRKVLKSNAGATPGGSNAMVMTPVSQRGIGGAIATPKSVRISAATPSTRGGGDDDDAGVALVPDVLRVLNENGVDLNDEAGEALQTVLKSHTLRMQGLIRGRDISRLAVRERNAKIGQLQARVTALEAELETQKAVIANLNWQKETGHFD